MAPSCQQSAFISAGLGPKLQRTEVCFSSLGDHLCLAAQSFEGSIHLWQAKLSTLESVASDVCSVAEQHRAKLFASRADGRRFLKGRAFLRKLLSAYLGEEAASVRLDSPQNQKPCVPGRGVSFNLSHSGAQLVIALRPSGSVGVDVQQAKDSLDELVLARSLFSADEVRYLAGLGGRDLSREFFRLWTCREAILKTTGVGFRGRDLILRRLIDGSYGISSMPSGWGSIELLEFIPDHNCFGALAWSLPAKGLRIAHFAVT